MSESGFAEAAESVPRAKPQEAVAVFQTTLHIIRRQALGSGVMPGNDNWHRLRKTCGQRCDEEEDAMKKSSYHCHWVQRYE